MGSGEFVLAFGPAESAALISLNVETDRAGQCPMSEPNTAGLLPLLRGFEAGDLSCARAHVRVVVSHEGHCTPHDGSAAANKVSAKPVPYVCRRSVGTGRNTWWGVVSAGTTHVVTHTIMIAQEGET
jgi:hypothetical protein